ncbi:MAG: glycosyltransferase family 4 protein [Nitrospirota bacterium]
MKYKLAVLSSHPIQYQVPLFRKLAAHQDIDLTVYFCRNFGVGKEQLDPGFGIKLKWDIPLLEGYRYKFLTNISPKPDSDFWGQVNPAIIKELRENRYDAIWVHGYASVTNWFSFGGAWTGKTPILLRGESHLLNYRPWWKRFFKRMILSSLFKRISAFLTIGTLNAEYYRHYGVPEKKMFLTPYSVDNDFFLKNYEELFDRRNNFKKGLDIASETPVILYASKMMPRKRSTDLLKAYEKVQEKIDVALVFVGDGVEKPFLEAYTKGHNLKNVHFVGFKNQTELPNYFVIADVFVLPSTDEPWGLVINEAMNFGLPVITTDKVGAAPDLVKDVENGFIYPVGDIEKLAYCLLKLLLEPELRERMGKSSSEIISRWSYKEDVDGILAALEYVRKH